MIQHYLSPYSDIIGMLGVGLTLIAYFALQMEMITSNGKWYSFLNLIGACMVLFSLFYQWNMPSAIMEGIWIVISLYGLVKAYIQPNYESA